MKLFENRFDLELELEILDDWVDPNPAPVIEEIEGFQVVRDDYLDGGSKVRFCDFLISRSEKNEFVYGSAPRWGYGPVSAAAVCHRYNKKFTCFLAESKVKHPNYYLMRDNFGANVVEVPVGFLKVTEAKAREYVQKDPKNRELLPIGLEHPLVLASIVKVARSMGITPSRFVTTGSSGTLNRGLQLAWPKAQAHVLSVGHTMSDREIGKAILHKSELKFPQHPKKGDMPPFPCVAEYEGKLWKLMREIGKKGDLVWNVASGPIKE
jgi:hypothetical protein